MESPRSHQELNPQSITDQYTNQQFPDIPVDNLQVAKSSENSNPQDLRVNPELRNNNTPNQEGNDLIEIPVPHKESAEEALQQSPKSPKQDKIEADNGSAAISPGQENVNNAKYEVKVNENAESVKDSLNQAINVIRGEENQTSSSTHEEKTLKINVVNVTEETNEAVKSESPPNGSRLKDRSPNLKLLIVTNQNIGGPLNSFESNEASNIESGVVGANIKKCHSSSEIPATEGENPNKQSESPGTMKKNASTNSLVVKEEENKAEPVSASPSRPKLSMEDFHKITSVGKGSYGEVFLVKKISNNKLYALKAIDKNFMKKEKKEHQVYVEREVLLKLNHPNIIRLYSSFQDKLKLYFVLEYVGGGEFSDYLRVHGKLSKDQIIFFAAEIVNILEYLHDCGIAHRDMKPENLLLTPEGHLKCIDFGTAKFLATEKRSAELFTKNDAADANGEAKPAPRRAHRSTFVGTAQYVSPEMLEGSDCGAAADLWAFGCMIYLMAVGQFPFADSNEYLIFQKIKAVTVTYPEDMDLEIKDLIQKLFVKDPIMRLGAGEKGSKNDYEGLKAHSLFRGIDFAKLHEQKPPLVEIASPHKRRSHDFEPAGLASNQQQARKHFHSDDLSRQENKDTKAVEFPTDKAIRVILSGLVLKKTGWLFYRPRQLILNSKPRLVYYDPDSNQLKGEITLAPTTKAELESKTKFTITTPTKKFVFKEMEHSAEKWVEIVNTAVQQLYAKKPEK